MHGQGHDAFESNQQDQMEDLPARLLASVDAVKFVLLVSCNVTPGPTTRTTQTTSNSGHSLVLIKLYRMNGVCDSGEGYDEYDDTC